MEQAINTRIAAYITALNDEDEMRCKAQSTWFKRYRSYRIDDAYRGKKFIRIVADDAFQPVGQAPAQTNVEAFIDPSTGEVFKPAGFNRPAKGVRYSLTNDQSFARLIMVAGTPMYLYK